MNLGAAFGGLAKLGPAGVCSACILVVRHPDHPDDAWGMRARAQAGGRQCGGSPGP